MRGESAASPRVAGRSPSPLQLSGRHVIHSDAAPTNKQETHTTSPKALALARVMSPAAESAWELDARGGKTSQLHQCEFEYDYQEQYHQQQQQKQAQGHKRRLSDPHSDATGVSTSSTEADMLLQQQVVAPAPAPARRFVPLHNRWSYGQAVFARYKRTPYFYSANIATYLGASMFMVVFDDGSLDYRVRREDLMVRDPPPPPSPASSCQHQKQNRRHRQPRASDEDDNDHEESPRSAGRYGDHWEPGDQDNALSRSSPRRRSQRQYHFDDESDDVFPDLPSFPPEQQLGQWQHLMVDFSVLPPREVVLSFEEPEDNGKEGIDNEARDTEPYGAAWRWQLEEGSHTVKRLECGVGYEDDSTQVSDSDDSSEEDMMMTPWQQMTQTFGMGKVGRGPRGATRRSSVSSVSQIERLSVKQKSMTQILASPKSLKQTITDYLLRGTKKVQPSQHGPTLALTEHVRLMEAKLNVLRGAEPVSAASTRSSAPSVDISSTRVVYERAPDGVRAYGTIRSRLKDGDYAVVTEDEQTITVQVLPQHKLEFLPSVRELEQQMCDLKRASRELFAGQKVSVTLYPGSRFSGHGLITLEREPQSSFNVLLANRIRLLNVPADKITPLREKKKAAVTITEDQFLLCNKVKVYIGDQILVKCGGDLDGSLEEEKLGLLNGVYSNRTAAVDFADGSTGYEVSPILISKRKRKQVPADLDVRSLKNAVLMQASSGGGLPVLEEGYQVKADHPRKAAVESCVVIKVHPSSACDLRFSDGTIVFEIFPSQMFLDSMHQQRTSHYTAASTLSTNASANPHAHPPPDYAVGDYVLGWSSRFSRYCSAKISAKVSEDLSDESTASGVLGSPSVTSIASMSASATALYTLVFDYGEQKAHMSPDKLTRLDDALALAHPQLLTNYSIDTMGFELSPVCFAVGEAVMARVHGSARYFNGFVEAVHEKERLCTVYFDSSERDTAVPFSAMFSVDARLRFQTRNASNKLGGSGTSSSSGAASRSRFPSRNREDTVVGADTPTARNSRRHSGGSVGSMIKFVAENLFRSTRRDSSGEQRRGSHIVTEVGARIRARSQQPSIVATK